MAKQYDILLRILLIGDSGVGKTCMICRFADDTFIRGDMATIGIDFRMKSVELNGTKVRIQLWDTAGQERFETLTKQYYRRAHGIFLVYDITNAQTFEHLGKWHDYIKKFAEEDVQLMLLGNKSDIDDKRQVEREQAQNFAKSLNIPFYETSAKESENIQQAFLKGCSMIMRKHKKEFDSIHLERQDSDVSDLYISELLRENGNKPGSCCVLT